MKNSFRLLAIVIGLLCSLSAFAQRTRPAPGDPVAPPVSVKVAGPENLWMISQAETIVKGTITEINEVEVASGGRDGSSPNGDYYGGAGSFGGIGGAALKTLEVKVAVDGSAKGNVQKDSVVTYKIRLQPKFENVTSPTTGEKTMTITGYLPDLKVKQQAVFFARRTQDGNTIQYPVQGVQPVEKFDAIVETAKKYSVKVTTEIKGTNFEIGNPVAVKVKVTNDTDEKVSITNVNLDGFYLAKRMDSNIYSQPVPAPKGVTVDAYPTFAKPIDIAAKDTATITVYFKLNVPQSWKLFDSSSFLQAPAALRATVSVIQKTAGNTISMQSSSELAKVTIGFPIPADIDL
ncbi:MAG: hypothetical protein WCJ56_13415 [bacterium]